jgi:hypothetical protein
VHLGAGVDKASYCVKRSDSTRFDTEYAQIEQDLVNLWGKPPIVGKSTQKAWLLGAFNLLFLKGNWWAVLDSNQRPIG